MAEEGHANPFGAIAAQWMESWRAMASAAVGTSETWSNSMLPFIMKRAAESGFGTAAGSDLAEAIERMAKGPRLADVLDFDRKLASMAAAWSELQSTLAAYHVVASRPWTRAADAMVPFAALAPDASWREAVEALQRHGLSQLPVVDGDAVLGWVGDRELALAALGAELELTGSPRPPPDGSRG